MSLEENETNMLCSRNSEERSCVRFFNNTRRKVEIFWIDFIGRPVLYTTLEDNQFVDINTYVTHPWIFIDYVTKERYLVNKDTAYMPRAARIRGWQQPGNQPVLMRDLVHIIPPLYSLRELCIRLIKERLNHDKEAFLLQLPKTLQCEIANAPPRKV